MEREKGTESVKLSVLSLLEVLCPYKCPTVHWKEKFWEDFFKRKKRVPFMGSEFHFNSKVVVLLKACLNSINSTINLKCTVFQNSAVRRNLGLELPLKSLSGRTRRLFFDDLGSGNNGPWLNSWSWKNILLTGNKQSNFGNASKPWRISNPEINRMPRRSVSESQGRSGWMSINGRWLHKMFLKYQDSLKSMSFL